MEGNNKPVVNLISKPENMLKTVYTACRTCYSADYPINIYESTDDEEKNAETNQKGYWLRSLLYDRTYSG